MPLLRDFISQVELPGYNFQLLVIITYIVQQRDDDLSSYIIVQFPELVQQKQLSE